MRSCSHWIRSFLPDRHQFVKVNGVKSEKRKVLSGVPQGSVIGPLLFGKYINYLPEVVRAILYLFADDTKLLKTVTSLQILASQVPSEKVSRFNTWEVRKHQTLSSLPAW